MDLLLIGIDGATKEIINSMPMPFAQELFSKSGVKLLDEDLISRGWAEILTGEHASTNRAFYQMPVNDKSYEFSCSYSKVDMLAAAGNPPLWKVANESGKTVGFMNVPTTGPADEVEGFLVAGGGGGLEVGLSIPDSMVHPKRYLAMLRSRGYVQDIRLPGGEATVSGFIDKIAQAEAVQADAFIDMAQAEKPDFGFFCFRMTTEIQYLARYDIQCCAEGRRKAEEVGDEFNPQSAVQAKILQYYASLDDKLRKIFDSLSPANHIVTGDHSTAIFEYEANIDVWLAEAGYLTCMSTVERKVRSGVFRLRRRAESFANRFHSSTKPSRVRRPLTPFSRSRTKAFGTFYDTGNFAGIYINDRHRFGGPVKTEQECDNLVDEICKHVNDADIARNYGLRAHPFRRRYRGSAYQELMPDIEILKPDNIYFSGRSWCEIQRNSALRALGNDINGLRFPTTGVKGSDPVLTFSTSLQRYISPDDPDDLRVVYRMICRYLRAQS